jgi:hypothetical protein
MTQLQHLVGLIITCCVLSAQSVTVTPGEWNAHGIEITPYSSRRFAAKVRAATPTSVDVTPLHPFSFFLTNNTGHAIVAYSALWTMKNANGIVTQHNRLAGSLRSSIIGNFSIPIGADRLVAVVTQDSVASPANSKALSYIQNAILQARNIFPSHGSVTVSLEAIVLDDGLALGPDSTQAIPRLRAEAEAPKKLASEVLNAFNNGGDQAVIDLMSGITAGPYSSSLAASRMSSANDAYAAFVAHSRYMLARVWLAMAKMRGPWLERLATQQANETYLAVHR